MTKYTYGYYLVEAMKELTPPTHLYKIVARALKNINCKGKRKYNEEQLYKALDVGLRFGIIREVDNKYYLYEYGRVSATGEIMYDFNKKPVDAVEAHSDSESGHKLTFPMKRKCQDDGTDFIKKSRLC